MSTARPGGGGDDAAASEGDGDGDEARLCEESRERKGEEGEKWAE